eukprot:4582920-Pleurochrysis_carterae.AAC.2
MAETRAGRGSKKSHAKPAKRGGEPERARECDFEPCVCERLERKRKNVSVRACTRPSKSTGFGALVGSANADACAEAAIARRATCIVLLDEKLELADGARALVRRVRPLRRVFTRAQPHHQVRAPLPSGGVSAATTRDAVRGATGTISCTAGRTARAVTCFHAFLLIRQLAADAELKGTATHAPP